MRRENVGYWRGEQANGIARVSWYVCQAINMHVR
jgi:hypothetical protein